MIGLETKQGTFDLAAYFSPGPCISQLLGRDNALLCPIPNGVQKAPLRLLHLSNTPGVVSYAEHPAQMPHDPGLNYTG